ncbi:MAG TPA: hypothetical protein VHQ86_02350 [Candidatus Saccharimonadia bacterium]|nr:hypothetical protein [Candidatus Saccharimonadia bacterium]
MGPAVQRVQPEQTVVQTAAGEVQGTLAGPAAPAAPEQAVPAPTAPEPAQPAMGTARVGGAEQMAPPAGFVPPAESQGTPTTYGSSEIRATGSAAVPQQPGPEAGPDTKAA